jgi:hypothetical protein
MVKPRSTTLLRLLPALLLSTAAVARAAPAPQPPAEAEEDPRAVEARKACAAGQVDRGVAILADYLSKTSDTTAIYNMARCYQQNGVADRALVKFREYLRLATDLTPDDRRDVEAHIRELEATQRLPPSSAPTLLEPVPPPAVDAVVAGRPGLRTAGMVVGGAGVVALGAGLVFALQVRSANRDLAREQTLPSWEKRRSEGETAETWQWVMLGTAGAALAGGGVLYLLGLPRPAESHATLVPWVAARGGGLALAGAY